MRFQYGRGRRKSRIERYQGTGSGTWLKAPGEPSSQHSSSRQSRFVVIVKVPDKQTENVVTALIKAVRKLPVSLRRSLTLDRGTEFANHAQFTVAIDVQVYFCDPSSPW